MKKDTPKEQKRHTVSVKPGGKVALCRCWQSKKFPYCDGSHRNIDTSHGPVIVEGQIDE